MTLTGDEAEKFMAEVAARAKAKAAEVLSAAKLEAAERGKEPFDLDRLESLCDTSHEGRVAPRNERFARLEGEYYVLFPDIMTLEEFARKVEELERW